LPALARAALHLVVAAGLLFSALTPIQAQQGWEPVVAAARPGPPPAVRPAGSPALEAFMARAQVAEPATAAADPAAPAARTRKLPEIPAGQASAARQYCINIANAAADARYAWQKKTLLDIEQELEKRIALLEAKTAEYRKWVARRDEFVKKARDNLVVIYARMRPDAAARQLMAMDEETAAAVLVKLDPRSASTILNEMDPVQAARLTATISGAARTTPEARPRQAGPEEKKS
jgi:flagellar motility protein MotE (MotC chaperone)